LSSNVTKLRNLMPWLSYVFTICHMKRGFDPMNFLRLRNLTHEERVWSYEFLTSLQSDTWSGWCHDCLVSLFVRGGGDDHPDCRFCWYPSEGMQFCWYFMFFWIRKKRVLRCHQFVTPSFCDSMCNALYSWASSREMKFLGCGFAGMRARKGY
jgi:hypothetical protein